MRAATVGCVVHLQTDRMAHIELPCGVLVPGPDVSDGVPLVRVGDIDQGRVEVSGLKRIARTIADRFSKTYVRGGEVLLTLVGTIGRSGMHCPNQLTGAHSSPDKLALSIQRLFLLRVVSRGHSLDKRQCLQVGFKLMVRGLNL